MTKKSVPAGGRRSYGTGSLFIRTDTAGREAWYGKWRQNGRQVKRKIGPKRAAGGRVGLTRVQAEAELRTLTAETDVSASVAELLTVAELTDRYLTYLEGRGRKRSTLTAVESAARVWLVPFFAGRSLVSIRPEDVTDLIARMEADGLSAKSIRNYIGTLGAMLTYAEKRRWTGSNPTRQVELPPVPRCEEIRFLTPEEVEAVIAAVPEGPEQLLERALYRTAAMAGLRVGELLALRWQDVDWTAARIRVRRNYVRGEFGTPKSRRSTRSVPMADTVGGDLERLYQGSGFQADGDLVFGDPQTGEPLTQFKVLKRFRRSLKAAALDPSPRFHDLRHTFGTQCAGAGVPMRTLQEWMGHRDIQTTQRYADYAPSGREADLIATAFGRGTNPGTNLREPKLI